MFVVPSFYGFQDAGKIDSDAAAFFSRVTAAGGSLTTTEKAAILQLVLDLKSYGIWNLMKAIYPMVGGGNANLAAAQAACEQNLVSSSFTGSFSSGWTFSSTGVTPNGTSAFMNTNFNPVSQSSLQNSFFMSVYIRTNSNIGNPYDIGNAENVNFGTKFTGIITRYNSSLRYISVCDPYSTSNSESDSRGFYAGGTNGSSTQILYKNGTNVLSGTSSQQGFANNTIWLAAANNLAGAFNSYSNKENAFATIGDGLSSTDASNFYTAVQAFQTTLSRQV